VSLVIVYLKIPCLFLLVQAAIEMYFPIEYPP